MGQSAGSPLWRPVMPYEHIAYEVENGFLIEPEK